jgi:hypothetical protein
MPDAVMRAWEMITALIHVGKKIQGITTTLNGQAVLSQRSTVRILDPLRTPVGRLRLHTTVSSPPIRKVAWLSE